MPTRSHHRHHRRDSSTNNTKKTSTKSVQTQTDENHFCLCFVPEYTAQLDEEQILDPRIRVMLDNINSTDDGKLTCVVRNFEQKPKYTPKERWRISGNAVRAVGKLKNKKKKQFMNVTLTNYEDDELRSGFYTRNLEYNYNEETEPDIFTQHRKRRWSLKRFSLKKRNRAPKRSMSEYQDGGSSYGDDNNRIVEASNGNGKVLEEQEQVKSKENIIIESFINECLRENMRNNNKTKDSESGYQNDTTDESSSIQYREEEITYSSENNQGRKRVARSVTLQDTHVSEPTAGRSRSAPREHRRVKSDAQINGEQQNRRPKSDYIAGREIVEATERQKRASEKYLNYIDSEKHGGSHRQLNQEKENSLGHGSTLSAFALVPGTELQRKLSQRGINDKASIDVIKQTTTSHRKYPHPSSASTRNFKYGDDRRSFHSVDNIYASSSSTKHISANNNLKSSHMSNNLQSSYSADDIDDPSAHLFKPLEETKTGEGRGDAGIAPLPPSMYVITSTPRGVEDVPEEHEEEEGYATYV